MGSEIESLLVLAALFFVGGPIVLFFLVIGARSRVTVLEKKVKELLDEMHRVRTKLAAPTFAQPPSAEIAPPPMAMPVAVPTAVFAPEDPNAPEPSTAEFDLSAEAFDSPFQPEAEPAPEPIPTPRPNKIYTPRPPSPPPQWLIKAKEWLFGGNLVAKVGLLILFFGVSFLLKYAAARVSVPIEFRLAAIVLADIGLLLWGWRIRIKRPAISLPVQGAALGILMLVTFGAFRIYHLIPGELAFGLLFCLTFFTCLLAVLQNAVWLAVFGIAGGFIAPILTSTGQGSHIGLFSYYALLNAGILAIALKRSWRLLNLLGFAFTFVISSTWGVLRYQPENFASVQAFLILFFIYYVAIAILYAARQAPRLKNYVDGTLVFGTPLLAFSLQYAIVHDKPFGLALSALVLGLFYIILALALWQRRASSLKLLVESFLALGIVFGTLAIPFALDGRWTSAAWALEGAGIVWVGLRQRQPLTWLFGVLVQLGAWISFVTSINGLSPEIAAKSNLWMGFLLLAGTGLAMAMNFRRRVDDGETPPVVAKLATLFLGLAALWLLAGAWGQIFLHAHGNLQGTLYVLSATFVAGVLGLIARQLNWGVARYFALVPQIAAGALFTLLLFGLVNDYGPSTESDFFDSRFLGALLISFSAAFSSLIFYRQPDGAQRGLSRMLLGWSALWWFALVLTNLADWGESMLAAHTTLGAGRDSLFHALYNLSVALTVLTCARLASRLNWFDLRWVAATVWPALLIAMIGILNTLLDYGLYLPSAVTWAGFAALWLASEWLLAIGQGEAWLLPTQCPRLLRVLHTVRTVGPWLILWPLGHHLVTLGLQPDSAQEAELLAESGWLTSASWARYLPAWLMMVCIAGLMPRVRADRWPVAPIADWYRRYLIPLGALWTLLLVVFWNFTQNGRMEPLPYLPILNPLDLTTGFAALLVVAAWRLYAAPDKRTPPSLLPRLAGLFGFIWFNLILLRTASHYLDITYEFEPLFHSQFVQTMLSLVWSATALVLMHFAAKRQIRTAWIAGALLVALVVAKLFFIDLSNAGGIERIVSFLGVGGLLLAIGYLAPFPTARSPSGEPA